MLEAEYTTMFEAEEHHWWYQGLHDQLVKAFARCRGLVTGPGRVLDAGCGTGKVLELLGDVGPVGLDLSATALDLARRRAPFALTRASAVSLPFAAGSFDVAVSLDVLANVAPAEVPAALGELYRVLAPGGVAAVTTFAPAGPVSRLTGGTSPAHAPTPAQMRALFTDAGFTVADQHRVARPSWMLIVSDLITVGIKP